MKELIFRSPVVLRNARTDCVGCEARGLPQMDRESGVHRPPSECFANEPKRQCASPADHHTFQPIPIWRRIRRARRWDFI